MVEFSKQDTFGFGGDGFIIISPIFYLTKYTNSLHLFRGNASFLVGFRGKFHAQGRIM
jgi:hypothetical protein